MKSPRLYLTTTRRRFKRMKQRQQSNEVRIVLAPILSEFRRRVELLEPFEVPDWCRRVAEAEGYNFERVEKPDAYETDD